MDNPIGAHLVGSVPLVSSEDVFDTVGGTLGSHLRRLPDGETGERSGWIGFQHDMLEKHPAVTLNPEGRTVPIRDLAGGISRENNLFVLNPEIPHEEIDFRPLGYRDAALDSYRVFATKRDENVIPEHVRFQVSLPTPFATGLLYFHPTSQVAFIERMEAALLAELAEICEHIPGEDLAIQWDCCQEILLLESYFPDDWAYDVKTLSPTLGRLGDAVPRDVELGYHLCYGSPVDAPLVRQHDLGVAVGLANDIQRALERPLTFIHLPVSDSSAGTEFFAPLSELTLDESVEVYLGLLHPKDPGDDPRRIADASRFLPRFGVATECGWGRKQPETVPEILALHARAFHG